MKVFISGASGLVGGNCLSWFESQGWPAIGTHLTFPTDKTYFFDTLHLNDERNFDVHAWQPDAIIHCGALTHVDYCESHNDESYQKTVQSTINLINLANTLNARFVFLSTDYVFDGKDGPYTESDVTNPLSVYGKHKLQAEQIIAENCRDYLIIRVTNVYGDEIRNKNFVSRILQQILNGDPLTLRLPIDQYASPTNAADIARAIFLLLQDHHSGIYHIGSTDYMNRVALSLRILKYYPNIKYELAALTTEQLQQAANRPLFGGFISKKFNELYPGFVFTTVDDYIGGFAQRN